MKVEIHNRIKAVREALKLSQRDFVKRVLISQPFLSDIESGKLSPSKRVIQLIVSELNVNKDWLLTGKGEMFSVPPHDKRLEKIKDIFNELDDIHKNHLLSEAKELLKLYKLKS